MNTPQPAPVILITGAARRVGAAIARELHAAGARVVLHYRNSGYEAHALAEELESLRPESTATIGGDLTEADVPARLIHVALQRFGRLDALVNNASSFYPTPIGEIDETAWTELIGSNLKAPLFLSQAAADALRAASGAIVNIVDIHAERPMRNYPLYCTAKAGLQGLTRALATDLAPDVRVNGIAPGPIMWPEDGQYSDVQRDKIVGDTLLRREGDPTDIARTARFLILEAPYITGQIVAVDGGRSAHL